MTSQKRGRNVDLENHFDTSHNPIKRARTGSSQVADDTFALTVQTRNGYSRLVLTIWSLSMTQHQKKYIAKNMKELMDLVSAKDLRRPPIKRCLPRWARKIGKPMDLSTMRNRLTNGGYSSVTDFVTDFRTMLCNVLRIKGWDHDKSVATLMLLQCFRKRMNYCPIGPGEQPMIKCDEDEVKLMASEIEDSIDVARTPSEKLEVVSIDDSDASEYEEGADESDTDSFEKIFLDSDISHDGLKDQSSEHKTAKTPEPDDLEEETRRLQEEIEERQQKLANMAERKKLLGEIKNMDIDKAAINGQMPEIQRQNAQFVS
jgi:hypothetical protein